MLSSNIASYFLYLRCLVSLIELLSWLLDCLASLLVFSSHLGSFCLFCLRIFVLRYLLLVVLGVFLFPSLLLVLM